jgi:TRAP-type uncharacterized transport system substrate-binding protein
LTTHHLDFRLFPAIALLVLLSACDTSRTSLRLVLPASEQDAGIVSDLATALRESSAFTLELLDRPASGEEALELLLAGDADLALVSNYLPFRDGISTVMPVYPSVLHIAYRQGRDTSSGFDLLYRANVFAGAEGSASRLMFRRVAERIGLNADDYTFIDSTAAIVPDSVDILVLFAPISPQRRAELADFRLYSLGTPAEIGHGSVVEAAALMNPPLRPYIIPATTYGAANASPIVTVAVDKVLVARDGLDAAVVYDLIDEIKRARPALSASRPGLFETHEQDLDVQKSTFVLHTGTQNYLQRNEPSVYERYSGIAEVAVTLLIGLISSAFAGIRILRIRRKNRIDKFYSAALQLRNQLAQATTSEQTAAAIGQLRTLQDDAFAQLVDEKLSADDSFRIFITLSNDILRQYTNQPD